DEGGDVAGLHGEVDVVEHEVVAEPGARAARLERGRTGRRSAGERDAMGPGRREGRGGWRRRRGDDIRHGSSPAGEGERRQGRRAGDDRFLERSRPMERAMVNSPRTSSMRTMAP